LNAEEQAWIRAHGPLRYAPHVETPPFEYFQKDGLAAGIVPEFLSVVARNLKVEIRPIRYEIWTEAVESVRDGKADFLGLIRLTPEREQFLLFSRPYLDVQNVLFVSRSTPDLARIGDLAGKRVGAVRGYAESAWLTSHHPEVAIVPVNTTREGLLMLALGRLEAMFDTLQVGQYLIEENSLSQLHALPEVLYTIPNHMAVAKHNQILRTILQKGLDSITAAERRAILNRWTGNPAGTQAWQLPGWVWKSALVLPLCLALFAVWNYSLRRQVARQSDQIRRQVEREASLERQYRELVENALDIVYTHDLEGNFTWINPAAEQMLGYSYQEAIGLNFTQIVAPEYLERVREQMKEKLDRDTGTTYELEVLTKTGRRLALEVNTRLVNRRNHQPQIQGIARDISDRKQAETELRRANRALRTISECNQALVRAVKEEELLRQICRNIVEYGGYRLAWVGLVENDSNCTFRPAARAGQKAGDSTDREISWDAVDPSRNPVGISLANGQLFVAHDIREDPRFASWQEEAVRFDYVAMIGLPLVFDERILGGMVIFASTTNAFDTAEVVLLQELAMDLAFGIATLRSRAEHQQAEEALKKSEFFLRKSQAVARLGSYDLDTLSGRWVSSDVMDEIFGIGKEYLKDVDGWIRLIHPDQQQEMLLHLQKDVLTEKHRFNKEYRIIRQSDFQERWVHGLGELEFDKNGKAIRMFGTIQDITERKLIEAAHTRLETQLRHMQKMEAVGQLAGGVAHDFNNLITVIIGNSDLLAEDPGLSAESQGMVEQIQAATKRAINLTRQLLTFSRKRVMEVQPLDLNEVLRNIYSMLHRVLGEHITLRCNYEPDLPHIAANAGMLEQVIVNLAVNARDAMPKGGSLFLATHCENLGADDLQRNPEARSGRFVVLTVTDTGSGIDPQLLPRIFEPFFTTKEIGKGTGLGLATSYGIIKQHQGWIEVASRLDHGTTFIIYLPAMQTKTSIGISSAESPRDPGCGKETILLVEDDPSVLALAKTCLQRCGYRVLEAKSGPEALRLWKETDGQADLLLTDMVMPGGMSGRDLADQLRTIRPDLKVIYSSGYSPETLEDNSGPAAQDRYLPKPYKPIMLTQTVRALLDAGNP